jgi:hypothetical protein
MITRGWLEAKREELERLKLQLVAHLNLNAGKLELIDEMLAEFEEDQKNDQKKDQVDDRPRGDET